MSEKYIKSVRHVIQLNKLTMLALASELGVENVTQASDQQIVDMLNELPEEINMVIVKDDASAGNAEADNSKECDLIRINALEPKYARHYIKYPLAGPGDLVSRFLIDEIKDKGQLGKRGPNGYISVAGLENYSTLRSQVEKLIGLKDLYTEVRKCTDVAARMKALNRKSNGKGAYSIDGNSASINGCYEIEVIGNFKNSKASLYKAYTLDSKVRKALNDDVALIELSRIAVDNSLSADRYPDSPLLAIATYYGCINTDDGLCNYDSFKPLTKGDYAMMIARMLNMDAGYDKALNKNEDALTAYSIVMKQFGIKESESTEPITRFEALKFASENFGPDASRMVSAYVEKAELSQIKGSNCFTDIPRKSQYDTYLVAAFFLMRAIDIDEVQDAMMGETLNMSKGIRLLFDFMEAYTNIELLNTEFISAESGRVN